MSALKRASAAALVAVAMIAAACGSGASTTSRAPVGGTMAIRLSGDWDHLDIQNFPSAASWNLSTAIYDRLVAVGPNGKLLPYLAKSWKQTASSVTFTLRNDATCADGTPVTPTVVANSFRRFFKLSQAPRQFGPGPYTVTADDAAGTFTVSLGTPYSDLVYSFTVASTGIVCPAGINNPADLQTRTFGSGPFVIESVNRGDSTTLRVRPEWKWGAYGITAKTPGFPDRLVFKVVANDTTAANLLLTGGLDLARVDGPDVRRLRSTPSLNHEVLQPFTNFAMTMNEAPGHPTADETVRQALMTAVDPKAWNQVANQGLGRTGTSFLTSSAECYDPGTAKLIPQPSPDKAKSILLAAGYTLGSDGKLQKDGKPLTIRVVANSTFGDGPEYISEQFNKAGITSVLSVTDYNTNAVNYRNGNFDVGFPTLAASVPAASTSISIISGAAPPTGVNIPRITDSYIDSEIRAALASSGTESCQHWANVQRRYLEKHHLLPLAAPDTTWFARGISFHQNFFAEPTSLARR